MAAAGRFALAQASLAVPRACCRFIESGRNAPAGPQHAVDPSASSRGQGMDGVVEVCAPPGRGRGQGAGG
jgi:hypothetical protein